LLELANWAPFIHAQYFVAFLAQQQKRWATGSLAQHGQTIPGIERA
jgi:hypothetical protein